MMMKQDDLTNKLRERLAGKEASVPDDLWAKIEQRLDESAVNATASHSSRRALSRRSVRLMAWMASAAAVALLLTMIGYDYNSDTIGTLARTNRDVAKASSENNINVNAVETNAVPMHVAPALLANAKVSVNAELDSVDANGATLPNRVDDFHDARVSDSSVPDVKKGDRHNAEAHVLGTYLGSGETMGLGSSTHRNRVRVGISTGGGLIGGSANSYPAMAFANKGVSVGDATAEGLGYYSDQNVYSLLAARYKETKHHNQPLSFGLTMSYSLTSRLSLSTGFVYTRASSDFISSTGTDEVISKQRLHYVGVPLSVDYRIWGNRIVEAYGMADAEADFNVKATMTTSGIKRDIDKDRVQFSLGIAAGLQYNVLSHVGIYAEPGVRYYIDNNSSLETIYKDQPWAFSLRLGLRLDF